MNSYTTEQLADRWEARRAVKNLMGRMTQAFLYRGEGQFFERFWSRREDVSLGVNDGWYLGAEAIRAYYASVEAETALADRVLRERFPALVGEGRAVGQFDAKPLSSDLVEIAGDGRSARGMWSCQGSDVRITAKGPLSYWTVGVYAADFLPEDGAWRLWHLLELRDIDCPCGEQWWRPRRERPDEKGFEAMAAAGRPAPTVGTPLHALWTPGRVRDAMPECPRPYKTFSESDSYGWKGGSGHAG